MRRIALALAFLLAAPAVPAEDGGAPGSHGIAMHGDLKYGPDFTHFDYVHPDAPKGGTLEMSGSGTFDTLNSFIRKGVPAAMTSSLPYDTLMVHAQDEPFSLYGLVAERIETPPDRSWVIFHLNPKARFNDGEPVTADDVVFSFNTLRDKGRPFFAAYWASVRQVEAVDRRTVRFSFEPGRENLELPLILAELPVLPEHYWRDREFAEVTLDPPLGSGPYRIAEVVPGRSIAYERVEDYWAADLPAVRGMYNFDRIEVEYYRDRTVAREAFKAGEFDYWQENQAKAWATAFDIPAVARGDVRKITVDQDTPAGMQAFIFNLRKPMFQDKRVRKAIGYAFDFQWTNHNLFFGQYTRTDSFFDNSELAAEGLPSQAELEILEPYRDELSEEVFSEDYEPPVYDGDGSIRPGQRKAMALLQEAGYVVRDMELVHEETGRGISFEIMLVSPEFERIVLPFVRNLRARLGIRANVRLVDAAQYQNRMRDFDFDMVVGGWGQSLSPGNEQRSYWASEAADIPGSRNYAGLEDPVVDELVAQVIAAPDREALVNRVRALDRVLLWHEFVVPNWHIPYERLLFWNKFGRPEVTPLRGHQLMAWWVDPAKEESLRTGQQAGQAGNE